MPYKVRTDMDEIEMKCELCLDLPCCPEHCCDVSTNQTIFFNLFSLIFVQWDTCACNKCDDCMKRRSKETASGPQRPASAYRKVFNPKTWNEDFVETDEPELFIRGDASKQ